MKRQISSKYEGDLKKKRKEERKKERKKERLTIKKKQTKKQLLCKGTLLKRKNTN